MTHEHPHTLRINCLCCLTWVTSSFNIVFTKTSHSHVTFLFKADSVSSLVECTWTSEKVISKDQFKLTFLELENTTYMIFLRVMWRFHKYHVSNKFTPKSEGCYLEQFDMRAFGKCSWYNQVGRIIGVILKGFTRCWVTAWKLLNTASRMQCNHGLLSMFSWPNQCNPMKECPFREWNVRKP